MLKKPKQLFFFYNKYINYLPIVIDSTLINCTLFILTTSPTNNIPYTLKLKMVFSEEDKHEKTLDFIPSTLWPANLPNINAVDYSICTVLQKRIYRSRIAGVEELKQRLVTEWANLDHRIISEAVGHWCARLSTFVRANGGHF